MDDLNEGDIIQITCEDDSWFPCLLIVDEVKSWGVQAYAIIPGGHGKTTGNAYYRVANGKFERVGSAVILG